MPDAAFNGMLPERFHDATVDHARHMFVHHFRLTDIDRRLRHQLAESGGREARYIVRILDKAST